MLIPMMVLCLATILSPIAGQAAEPEAKASDHAWQSSRLIPGDWEEATSEQRDDIKTILYALAPESYHPLIPHITRIRGIVLPFYHEAGLLEADVQGPVGTQGILSLVLHGKDLIVLDGKASTIQNLNAQLHLTLNTREQAEAYVQFFTNVLTGTAGTFHIIQSESDMVWAEGADTTRPVDLPRHIRPLTVEAAQDQTWNVAGTMQYCTTLYGTRLSIDRTGVVTMLEDTPVLKKLPVKMTHYRNGLRVIEPAVPRTPETTGETPAAPSHHQPQPEPGQNRATVASCCH